MTCKIIFYILVAKAKYMYEGTGLIWGKVGVFFAVTEDMHFFILSKIQVYQVFINGNL